MNKAKRCYDSTQAEVGHGSPEGRRKTSGRGGATPTWESQFRCGVLRTHSCPGVDGETSGMKTWLEQIGRGMQGIGLGSTWLGRAWGLWLEVLGLPGSGPACTTRLCSSLHPGKPGKGNCPRTNKGGFWVGFPTPVQEQQQTSVARRPGRGWLWPSVTIA